MFLVGKSKRKKACTNAENHVPIRILRVRQKKACTCCENHVPIVIFGTSLTYGRRYKIMYKV